MADPEQAILARGLDMDASELDLLKTSLAAQSLFSPGRLVEKRTD